VTSARDRMRAMEERTGRTLSSASSLPEVLRSDDCDAKALTSCLCRVWSFDEDEDMMD